MIFDLSCQAKCYQVQQFLRVTILSYKGMHVAFSKFNMFITYLSSALRTKSFDLTIFERFTSCFQHLVGHFEMHSGIVYFPLSREDYLKQCLLEHLAGKGYLECFIFVKPIV